MGWSDEISKRLDEALIRLDVLCHVYALPRELDGLGDGSDDQRMHHPTGASAEEGAR